MGRRNQFPTQSLIGVCRAPLRDVLSATSRGAVSREMASGRPEDQEKHDRKREENQDFTRQAQHCHHGTQSIWKAGSWEPVSGGGGRL